MIIEVDDKNKNRSEVFDINKTEITIGRGTDCDIQVVAEGVSRKHLRIFLDETSIMIEDLGSSNGTFINDQKITKQEFTTFFPATIGNGITISLKDV